MRKFTLVLLRDHDEEGFVVLVPELDGCFTQADTFEQAIDRGREAIAGHLRSLARAGEEIPPEPAEVVVASVEVEDVPATEPAGAAPS